MKKIYLTQGQFTLVDDEDFDRINKFRWCAHKGRTGKYYAEGGVGLTKRYMHKMIMNTPDGMVTDHIDGNGLNNQKSNLRVCTRSQNSMNKKGHGKTSIYKGVHFNTYARKNRTGQVILNYGYWKGSIVCDRKHIHLGTFKTEIEAAKAYDEAAKKYHGEFAVLNFPSIEKQVYCFPSYPVNFINKTR